LELALEAARNPEGKTIQGSVPQRLKPSELLPISARLKPCPDTNEKNSPADCDRAIFAETETRN
jgi:hypothetical protein